jgi:hypothetical protein
MRRIQSFRIARAIVVLALLGASCDSRVTDPRPATSVSARPHFLAVTAPEVAAPGSEILIRIHWASWDCGVTFAGFDTHTDAPGSLVIEPRWQRPASEYGCPAAAADIGREETMRITMPASGLLRLRVTVGDRSVDRAIVVGSAAPAPAWTIEAVELGTGQRVPGAPVTFFEATATSSSPVFIATGDTILAGMTDSVGVLRAELETPALGRRFAFIARHPGSHATCAIPVVAIPPIDQVAERTTLILDWPEAQGRRASREH